MPLSKNINPKLRFMKNVIQRHQYDNAAEIIKAAILKSQYEASKDINRIQLGLYFGIGKIGRAHV